MTMTDANSQNSEVRSKKLRQVQALLDKADDPGATEAEAEALRQKADDLMLLYAIEQYEVDQRKDKAVREQVEKRSVHVCSKDSVIKKQLIDMFFSLAFHCRCRAAVSAADSKFVDPIMHLYGFPSDLDYVEMLFVSLRLQMANNLEPKPDPDLDFVENLVLLKECGMKWERIHALLSDEPWERRHGVRYTGMYTNYCKEHERERMRTSPMTFQRNFADAFGLRVSRRLAEIKARQTEVTSGKELVLYDRKKEVDDFFKENANVSGTFKAAQGKFDQNARNRGAAAGDRADLGQKRMGSRRELT